MGSDMARQIAETLESMRIEQVQQREFMRIEQERQRLERLFIRPIYHIPSSSGSSRSPRKEERVDLKIHAVDYYGLWDSSTKHLAPKLRKVYTMLPSEDPDKPRVSVLFKDAILSHIWSSGQEEAVGNVAALLCLPDDFHVKPRNFLILDKEAEVAFDADAILLFPHGAGEGTFIGARSRLLRIERAGMDEESKKKVRTYAGRELFLPRANEGHVPYLRLLAWKAVSALRAREDERDASAELPDELVLNASLDDAKEAPLKAVARLREAGYKFSNLSRFSER